MINNNLTSAFYTTREIIPNMVSNKSGLIINISSIWGMVGASCESIYAISKAGLDAMTKSLAKELAPSNIRVNSIAPGAIDTEMNNLNDEDRKELNELMQQTPELGKRVVYSKDGFVPRMIVAIENPNTRKPDEIAKEVASYLSDAKCEHD